MKLLVGIFITAVLLTGLYFALSYPSLEHDGDLSDIGVTEVKDVEVRYLPSADNVMHYKFHANRLEIESIIRDQNLKSSADKQAKSISLPILFYPIFGEKEIYYGKAGYASLYLYFYPKKELAYYVHYDL